MPGGSGACCDGAGKMYCMAGLGGDVGPIVDTTRKASACASTTTPRGRSGS